MYTLLHQSRDPDNPLIEPMQVAAIELDDQPGLRYLSQVVNCSLSALRHDMPVKITWIEVKGRQWPVFEPVASEGC